MTDENHKTIVVKKEGWLLKRGEHIKTWRPRYFLLLADGSFLGYKFIPQDIGHFKEPLNTFTVRDCEIIHASKSNPNIFVLRGLVQGSSTERTFSADNESDKILWIEAIASVQKYLVTSKNGGEIRESKRIIDRVGGTQRKTLNDFEFLRLLGKGTFGKVILCRERLSGTICAIKILKKKVIIHRNEVAHTMCENKVLRCVNHPFITNLLYAFTTTDYLCLVMEYVNGGELFFHLSRERRFSETRSRFYIAEISSAIGYLHGHRVIYRDLKLENVLLDSDGHVKLVDFGLCKTGVNHTTATFCGTPEYIAPEVLQLEAYTSAIDWWSLGIVGYEMLIGRLPFSESNPQKLFNLIKFAPVPDPHGISSEAKSLLFGLLCRDPKRRLGGGSEDYRELEVHPFFKNIPFSDYERKLIEPPFRPQVTSSTDTRYFDQEFTNEPIRLSPPLIEDDEFANSVKENIFDQFTYLGSQSSLLTSRSRSSLIQNSLSSINSLSSGNVDMTTNFENVSTTPDTAECQFKQERLLTMAQLPAQSFYEMMHFDSAFTEQLCKALRADGYTLSTSLEHMDVDE